MTATAHMFRWNIEITCRSPRRTERFRVEAPTEAEACERAWVLAEPQQLSKANSYVSRCKKARGDGFAAGLGTQRQEVNRPVERHPDTVILAGGGTQGTPPAAPGSLDALVDARIEAKIGNAPLNEQAIQGIVSDTVAAAIANLPEPEAKATVIRVEAVQRPTVVLEERAHPLLEEVYQMVATPKPDGTRINVELVGPAGCGKTHLAGQLARAMQLDFSTTSFTAATPIGEIAGRMFPSMQGAEVHDSLFSKRYEFGGIFLGDEWDSADANIRGRFNGGLANGHFTTASGRVIPRHADTIILAASNTWGHGADGLYVAREKQDAASNDRFVKVFMDYDLALEREKMLETYGGPLAEQLVDEWQRVRVKARAAKVQQITSMRKGIDIAHLMHVKVAKTVKDAILRGTSDWSVADRAAIGY